MNKLKCAVIFAAGAAAGVASAWYFAKKRYEAIAQEEIDSVKEVFRRRAWCFAKTSENDICADFGKTQDAAPIDEPVRKGKAKHIISENGYAAKRDGCAVIAPEEYDDGDYEKISLTYYSDGILADEDGDIVDDYEDVVGEDFADNFGVYESDCVYVRNYDRECDYEILRSEERYSEAVRQ